MAVFIDTRGLAKVAVGICDRCKMKRPYVELRPDGNSPGLMVCQDDGCWDPVDPWRLPPRQTEDISLEHPRPDIKFTAPDPTLVPIPQLQALLGIGDGVTTVGTGGGGVIALADPVTQLNPSNPWQPNTNYNVNDQVTNGAPTGGNRQLLFDPGGQLFYVFTCVLPGKSGAVAPAFNNNPGSETFDGGVMWINTGLWLPS